MGIGQTYRVLGIPAHVHQWPNITWSIEANNVQLWEPECKLLNPVNEFKEFKTNVLYIFTG